MISREQFYIDLLKPEYNICLKAGSSLGRLVRKDTRLKIRNARIRKLYVESKGLTYREYLINVLDIKLNQSRLKIDKLYKEFDKILFLMKKKVRLYDTRSHVNATTYPSKTIFVTDTFNNVTTVYPSISRAAIALNVHKGVISRRLEGKITKLCKKRYIIQGTNDT